MKRVPQKLVVTLPKAAKAPGLIFEDPPPARGGMGAANLGKWERILMPLTRHPNKWARLRGKFWTSLVAAFKKRQVRVPKGRWEYTLRNVKNGKGHIYARFLGEK